MSVMIDEVVSEVAEPPAAGTVAAASPGTAAPPLDLDRLAYEMARRRHRAQRLWAD
jgi:hypothetical protein